MTEAPSISEDAVQLMKFHGSYMQDNREERTFGAGKSYQFMMRTRQPAGAVTNQLYLVMDELADLVGAGWVARRCAALGGEGCVLSGVERLSWLRPCRFAVCRDAKQSLVLLQCKAGMVQGRAGWQRQAGAKPLVVVCMHAADQKPTAACFVAAFLPPPPSCSTATARCASPRARPSSCTAR